MTVAEVSVTSEISTTSLALNQSLTYKLIIRGASNAGNIDQRIFKDFVVVSQSTSQNYSFINGAFESSITKFFTLNQKNRNTLYSGSNGCVGQPILHWSIVYHSSDRCCGSNATTCTTTVKSCRTNDVSNEFCGPV